MPTPEAVLKQNPDIKITRGGDGQIHIDFDEQPAQSVEVDPAKTPEQR